MAHNAKYSPENMLLIRGWRNDPEDKELLKLLPFLKFMSGVKDVRSVTKWQETFTQNDCLQVKQAPCGPVHVCRSKLIKKCSSRINLEILKEWEQSKGTLSLWSSPEHQEWIFKEDFYIDSLVQSPKGKLGQKSMWTDTVDLKDPRYVRQREILDELLQISSEAKCIQS